MIRFRSLALMVCLMFSVSMAAACAGSSSASRDDVGPAEPIGQPPEGVEAEYKPLPKGPEIIGHGGRSKPGAGGEHEPGAGSVSRAQVDAFMSRGPGFVFSLVDTEPAHEDGKFVGFQIVDLEAFAQRQVSPHLRVGDVVTHLNGVRLRSPDDFFEAWKSLHEAASIRVDFVRDGEPQHALWNVK